MRRSTESATDILPIVLAMLAAFVAVSAVVICTPGQGTLSNLGNPKMAVFFATLLPQFSPHGGASFVALFLLGILFCSLTLTWLTLYAIAVAKARRLIGKRVRRALDALTGVVLVALGLRLAAERG